MCDEEIKRDARIIKERNIPEEVLLNYLENLEEEYRIKLAKALAELDR